MTTFYDFEAQTLDGTTRSMREYEGDLVLVVNVASKCGLTPQYEGLQKLHEELGGKGVRVLGFPCNQFKGQEPGTEAEIQSFCSANYGVTFPMFAKIDVNGPDRHDLYAWMTSQPTTPEGPGDVQWNFGKFVIGRDGGVIARFEPTVEPDDPKLRALLK